MTMQEAADLIAEARSTGSARSRPRVERVLVQSPAGPGRWDVYHPDGTLDVAHEVAADELPAHKAGEGSTTGRDGVGTLTDAG